MVKEIKNDTSQDRIMIAAKNVFLVKGMSGARMQDIADEAGINKALLHYYFRNKEQLFEMIFKEASNKLFPKIIEIIESDIPLFEKIEGFCKEYIELLQQNTFLPLFVLNEVNKQPERFKEKFWKNRELIFTKFAAQVEKEIKRKKIRPVKPGQLFINMLSMCIFPFIAKPLWMISSGTTEFQFHDFMEERKTEIPRFIIESIKR